VLLTAGGTREPIDDVRVIANSSTGRLGAALAEAFARAGHDVTLLHGTHAARPDLGAGRIQCHAFGSSADLDVLLREHAPRADAVLHAAAVSDYLPERSAGKLSSDADELVLRLRRAPKLIDGLRALAPKALLVGFKLTSGKTEAERAAICAQLMRRAALDMVVSNEAAHIGERDHEVLVFGADGVLCRSVGKPRIAADLVAAVEGLAAAEASAS